MLLKNKNKKNTLSYMFRSRTVRKDSVSVWFEYILSISKKSAKAIEQYSKKRKMLLQVINEKKNIEAYKSETLR